MLGRGAKAGPDHIIISRDAAGLRQLGGELGAWLDALGLGGRLRYATELVAEEIATNLVKYGGDDPGKIELRLAWQPPGVELQIIDDTPPFSPLDAALPEPPTSLAAARPGGIGLKLVRQSVDQLNYGQISDGRNRLTALITGTRP